MSSRSQTKSPTPSQAQNATTTAITQTQTALATTPQSNLHLPALQSVLNNYPLTAKSNSNSQTNFIKSLSNQTSTACTKMLNEVPTYVHLSSKDSAPQLNLENDKLTVKGAFRGYRMVRGSHGVSAGNWYFEVVVLNPPKVSEVVKALPKNVRLGEALKEGLREGMMKEREEMRNKMMRQRQQQMEQYKQMQQQRLQAMAKASAGVQPGSAAGEASGCTAGAGSVGGSNKDGGGGENDDIHKKKKRKLDETSTKRTNSNNSANGSHVSTHATGGHLRIGWSMRTGELQAPVGYDRWSYGYRNISGSRVHNSQREDKWGGESFDAGDVIGFAVSLVDENANNGSNSSSNNNSGGSALNSAFGNVTGKAAKNTQNNTNHIRFFKNGEGQGHFIVSRGVRMGGAAFDNIPKGTYYPAISPYMGGAARINFGPHFIHPPRGLPSGMKVKPLSEVCTSPPTAESVLEMFKKEKVFGRKVDESVINAIHEAIQVEASLRYECYQKRMEKNIEEVRKARTERGLSTGDLPAPKEDLGGDSKDM